MLLAKSAGANGRAETLLDHSLNVRAMARLLYSRLTPAMRSREGLWPDLEAAALVHDIGKAASGFQQRLRGERADWNGWRHEVISAGFASNLQVTEAVLFAVLTHHRQIPGCNSDGGSRGRLHWGGGQFEDWPRMMEDWRINEESAVELWEQLCDEAGRPDLKQGAALGVGEVRLDVAWLDRIALRRQRKVISPEGRIKASILRGLLMSADHLASGGMTEIPQPLRLDRFCPAFVLRNFQRRCALKGNLILNAPTGSGKTEAALLWGAENQPENGRFFYTLPYTAALNAMHGRLRREFPKDSGSIGLLHGRAAHHLYAETQKDYPAEARKATAEAVSRARLAREAFYPVRVCTPHQLLRFTLRGKGWEQMLSEIPGACIVFDEVHSYDARLAGLTLGTARLFASMGANLMFISATLPEFMREQIRKLAPMSEISPDEEDESDRLVLDRKRHEVSFFDGNLLGLVDQIGEAVEAGRKALVVCNHVSSAQTVARALRMKIGGSPDCVCLFHGRFNMEDRKQKEAKLGSGELPRVLVATQVVEVSLDISFDLGFFEAAPIDALAQRMGRVNRQGRTPAPIVIAGSALSGHQIYKSEYVDRTVELLSRMEGALSEQDLTRICNKVYAEGYGGEEKRVFEERLNHPFLTRFEDSLVAGEHNEWIETVIEDRSGRADVLPVGLKGRYESLVLEKRWLEADALLVNAYTAGLAGHLDKSGDPWIVDLQYDHEGLHAAGKSVKRVM